MPKNGSVGYSDNTPLKQEHFRTLMQTHIPIVQSIMHRNNWVFPRYIYIDLNAGSGRYEDTDGHIILGSPLHTLEVGEMCRLPLWGFLCEQDKETCQRLRLALTEEGMLDNGGEEFTSGETAIWLHEGDYSTGLPQFLDALVNSPHIQNQQYYGLIYSDENGAIPPFGLLGECARHLHYCDLLIHVAATPIKRQFYSPMHPLMQRLDELMTTVPKDHWIVREPYGKHQWTFLIGTNWDSFPRFKRQGFWPIESPQGKSILRRLSYNREELYGQGNLFTT